MEICFSIGKYMWKERIDFMKSLYKSISYEFAGFTSFLQQGGSQEGHGISAVSNGVIFWKNIIPKDNVIDFLLA
jgi:hypothetical protein